MGVRRVHARADKDMRTQWTLLGLLLALASTGGCADHAGSPARASAGEGDRPAGPDGPGSPPAGAVAASPPAEACEVRTGDLYRTATAARIETVGGRPVLTLSCDGQRSIYLRVPSSVDLAGLAGQPSCARYRYVDQRRSPMPCVRPPCPDTERVLDLVDVRPAAGPAAICPP